MADTQEQLDALDAAIAARITSGGALSVQFNNRSVTFESLDDMLKARDLLASRLLIGTTHRYRLAVTNKMGHAEE